MSGKIKWNEGMPPIEHEVCDESTIYRLNDGGMDLDKSNLPEQGWLPELAPLYRDKSERKARVCLRVKVLEKAETTGATIKIKKNKFCQFVKSGMFLSDGTNVITVKSVDTSNEEYDVITATKNLTAAIEPSFPKQKGQVMQKPNIQQTSLLLVGAKWMMRIR